MGFLATVWGKPKYMPSSKKKEARSNYMYASLRQKNKKANGRNMKKAKKSFDS
jgi:hypothetical protein